MRSPDGAKRNPGLLATGDLPRIALRSIPATAILTPPDRQIPGFGADQFERALHQFGSDAAAAQRAGRFGMGDDDRRGRDAIIRKRHGALDVEFEAVLSLVVADGGHAAIPG